MMIKVPDGFQLVTWGLGRTRLCDPRQPRHWEGLSQDDRDILLAWVGEIAGEITGMWTHVPVGIVPDCPDEHVGTPIERVIAGKWPLRIDCVIQRHGTWTVIEVKPDAGHEALGQLLTYGYYARAAIDQLKDCKLMVLTDHCNECVRPLFDEFGITVVEVGSVLGNR